MSEVIQVEVPTVGESISEVQIGKWLKSDGDWVAEGEDLVEIETEKASVQIPSPASGFLQDISKAEEEFAAVGDVIAAILAAEKPTGNSSQPTPATSAAGERDANAATTPAQRIDGGVHSTASPSLGEAIVMPAARRLLEENGLQPSQVPASGPGGRLLKEDVLAFLSQERTSAPASLDQPASPRRSR